MTDHINLDDTTHCPLDETCAHCGAARDLAVAAYDTSIGVFCQTMCGTCIDGGERDMQTPQYGIALRIVIERVISHCKHLGIDLDQMAAAMEEETE